MSLSLISYGAIMGSFSSNFNDIVDYSCRNPQPRRGAFPLGESWIKDYRSLVSPSKRVIGLVLQYPVYREASTIMHSERTMFPMMGIGVFNIMFWTGFVVGHNIGLACSLMLINALLFGSLGSYAVVRLERLSRGASRPTRTKAEPPLEPLRYSSRPVFQA